MNQYRGLTKFIQPRPLSILADHLLNAMNEGHVCLDTGHIDSEDIRDDVLEYTRLLNSDPERLYNEWLGGPEEKKPLIFSAGKLFLQRFYNYEHSIINAIHELVAGEDTAERAERLQSLRSRLPANFIRISSVPDWQWIACLSAFIQKFTIITGGPGTGKTSTVNRLLYLLLCDNPELRISLAAPTGKAAARLKESLQGIRRRFHLEDINADDSITSLIEHIPASTVHSLLGYIPDSIHFRHNKENKLDADVLIIDECSMIDLQLFKKLFDAVDTSRTQLILLGDKNQLASVEMGNVFGQLCGSIQKKNTFSRTYQDIFTSFHKDLLCPEDHPSEQNFLHNHIIELQRSFRFSNDKGIGQLSRAVLNEDEEAIIHFWKSGDEEVTTVPLFDYHQAVSLITSGSSYFHEEDIQAALKKMNHYRILTSQNQGPLGVHEMNKRIEAELMKMQVIGKTGRYYHNQLIIVTHNQPKLGIYNGDTGIIREVVVNSRPVMLAFFEDAESGYKTVIPLEIKSFETAYAMTIHKSQGSEFDHVALVLPDNDIEHLLNKELVYTAITRARQHLTIYGDPDLFLAITQRRFSRQSGLNDILKDKNTAK